jgi:hypothetical protein
METTNGEGRGREIQVEAIGSALDGIGVVVHIFMSF